VSYKYKINAVSYVGESQQSCNEFFFADNVSSVNQGVCNGANICTDSKGKKHVFSVASCGDAASKLCGYLGDVLLYRNSGKMRIKVQYDLKGRMEEVSDVICRGDEEAGLSMLCIDGGNVYAAGFGDINIYHFSKKDKLARKIVFPQSSLVSQSDSDDDSSVSTKVRQPARSRCIGSVKSGDEYLLVGSALQSILGDEQICDILTKHKGDAPSVLIETAYALDSSCNLTAVHVATKKQHKAIWFSILALLAIACGIVSAYMLAPVVDKSGPAQAPESPSASSSADSAGELAMPESKPKLNALQELAPQLDAIAMSVTGAQSKVAYYVKNLTTGDSIEKNDSKMYSASLIKLYIMAEIYRQADAGELAIDASIKDKLTRMITVSDNDACNQLAAIAGGGDMELGFQKITSNALALGCTYTQQKNDLQAVRTVPIPVGNFTSVKDCGIILEKIYNGELVNDEYSSEMLELLKNQQRRFKIPKYIPAGVTIANKTGETSTAQNDVAIIYTDKADYIICIMINDYANSMDDAMDIVARMSEAAYNYITQ